MMVPTTANKHTGVKRYTWTSIIIIYSTQYSNENTPLYTWIYIIITNIRLVCNTVMKTRHSAKKPDRQCTITTDDRRDHL